MSRHEHHPVDLGRRGFLAAGAAIPALAGMSLTTSRPRSPGRPPARPAPTRNGASRAPIPAGSSKSATPG
jgi:hypothetical protein